MIRRPRLSSTPRTTQLYRNLEALDLRTGKSRMLFHGGPHRRHRVSTRADRSLWGLRFINGHDVLVRLPSPYKEWYKLYVFPANEQAFDLDLSPDGSLASVSVSGPGPRVGSPQVTQVRVHAHRRARPGRCHTAAHVRRWATAVPEGFVFSQGRPLSLRQQLLHRGIEHLPLRARDRETDGSEQRCDRLLSPAAARRYPAHRAALLRRRASCRR